MPTFSTVSYPTKFSLIFTFHLRSWPVENDERVERNAAAALRKHFDWIDVALQKIAATCCAERGERLQARF